jgi:hypothetical protein
MRLYLDLELDEGPPKGASPELSVKTGPPAPLCEIAKSSVLISGCRSVTPCIMMGTVASKSEINECFQNVGANVY